jgi:hypothetical protein
VAKPKREKKPAPSKPPALRVLPMQLKIGDLFTAARGEWRVIGHPYSAAGGKNVFARAELVQQPGVIEAHLWGAHERVAVTRSGAGGAP